MTEFELRFAGWLRRYGAEQVARVALGTLIGVAMGERDFSVAQALDSFDGVLKEHDDHDGNG